MAPRYILSLSLSPNIFSRNLRGCSRLLQVNFTDKLNPKVNKMQLCSIWCLLFAVPGSLGLKYSGAHVSDSELSWICNNTEKYGGNKGNDAAKQAAIPSLKRNNIECWTVFSTREFGSANKVPQENIPPRKEKEVTQKLLNAFCRVTKLSRSKVAPVYTRVQLWGAAVPMNVLDNGANCVLDVEHNVGICGDWLSSPSIEGAAVSGLELAERIQAHTQGRTLDSVKINFRFNRVKLIAKIYNDLRN